MSKQKQKPKQNKALMAIIIVVAFLVVAGIVFLALPSGKNATETAVDDTETTSDQTSGGEDITEGVPEVEEGVWDGQGEELMSGKVNAKIEIENYGTISLELDGDAAPITVTNFVNLAKDGFYDGLTFHRIMEGFMMQGGDPEGTGMGGSDTNIKGEFATNGVDNPLSHTRGAISMARSQMPNSASSQFFICHEDATFLDGDYACFGYVTDGIDVVDAVCTDSKPVDNNGTIPPENQPKIVSVTIED